MSAVQHIFPDEHGRSQIERREAAEIECARLRGENDRLRAIISECASAIGNGAFASPKCSLEFLALIPGEIRSVTGARPIRRDSAA